MGAVIARCPITQGFTQYNSPHRLPLRAQIRQDLSMGGDLSDGYLDGLPPVQAAELARVNEPGLRALRD